MDFFTALTRAGKRLLGNIGNGVLGVAIILAVGFIGLRTSIYFYGSVVFGVLALILGPFIFILGCLIIKKNHRLGTFLIAAGPIMIITSLIQCKFPEVFPGIAHQASVAREALDQKAEASAVMHETPERIPCAPPYWVGARGEARFFAVRYRGKIECYDKPGRHPLNRRYAIVALTDAMADEIELERESSAPPAPVVQASIQKPPPEAPTQPTPAPAPQEWNEERPVPVMSFPPR